MTDPDLIAALMQIAEKGGAPAVAIAALILTYWKFKSDPKEDNGVHRALGEVRREMESLTQIVAAMGKEMTDRMARVETHIENLKDRHK